MRSYWYKLFQWSINHTEVNKYLLAYYVQIHFLQKVTIISPKEILCFIFVWNDELLEDLGSKIQVIIYDMV